MDISTNSELFKTFDNLKLFEQSFSPEGEIKGVIIIIHGLTEHSGFYTRVSRNLAEHQYAVNLYDLRGHGKSDGPLAFIDSLDEYLDDLSVFLGLVKNRYPKKPIFLLGQGIGGIISALYVIENRPEIRGLILSAPALDLNQFLSPFMQKMSWILGKLFSRLPLVKMNSSALSKDPLVIQDYEKDPLIYHGKIYAGTCLELIRASKAVMKQGNEIEKPILIVHGKKDQLYRFEGSQALYEKVAHADKTIKLYEDHHHSLLIESKDKKAYKDILQWTDSHVRTD
jgi:alpha-beta hydrolase superfamily lysophospholipase